MARRLKCGRCPKIDFGWCPIRAEMRRRDAPVCDYGRKLMNNAYMAKYMRERRRAKKQQAYNNKERRLCHD